MKRNDFLRLKAGLLCNGMKITDDARVELQREYPHFFVKGFVHATNMSVFGSNLCVSIADGYSRSSEYTLCRSDKGYTITFDAGEVSVRFFGALPKTGSVVDGMAQLHAPGCINIWPSSACCYDTDELKCKFCSLEKESSRPLAIEVLADGIRKLLEMMPSGKNVLNMSGGTYVSPDYMADYYVMLVKKIREFSLCPITV
jgi:hypothetical protein